MSTVAAVVDRVFERLHAPDEQPIRAQLLYDTTANATTWQVEMATLTPEEKDLLAVGVMVECGRDMRMIEDANTSTGIITVGPATNGTTAAAHTAGDYVTLNPHFSRQRVFDAVADQVTELYPHVWRQTTSALTSTSTFAEAPAECIQPLHFLYELSTNRWHRGAVEFLDNFPPSSTGKAVSFLGVPPNKSGHLVYRAKFARPTSESDDLATLGVQPEWEKIVVVGAVADVIASADVDKLTAEWLSRQLEQQQVPVGSSTRLRDSWLRWRQILLDDAERRLRAERPIPVVFTDAAAAGF